MPNLAYSLAKTFDMPKSPVLAVEYAIVPETPLIAAIDEDLALRIISGMKSKVAGEVLSKLDVKVAKAISEKLAGKAVDAKK